MKPKTMECWNCHKRKDFNRQHFGVASGNHHGLTLKCKACLNRARHRHH